MGARCSGAFQLCGSPGELTEREDFCTLAGCEGPNSSSDASTVIMHDIWNETTDFKTV